MNGMLVYSQMIVSSLYAPDGNVDTLSAFLLIQCESPHMEPSPKLTREPWFHRRIYVCCFRVSAVYCAEPAALLKSQLTSSHTGY